jgi:hypothetical protein
MFLIMEIDELRELSMGYASEVGGFQRRIIEEDDPCRDAYHSSELLADLYQQSVREEFAE